MRRIQAIAMGPLCSLTVTLLLSSMVHRSATAQEPILMSQVDDITALCEASPTVSARFECLFEQSNRLNQAKNFARQLAERENGGVSLIEAEPSMHGPSAESPHVINDDGRVSQYTFTFRLRPRATTAYTREAQVFATYNQQTTEWDIELGYNRAIAPTSCSYAADLQDECS
ncbi:MAG: hypothetical protein ACFE0I_23895 [Elainellaceae cyanobacterium]